MKQGSTKVCANTPEATGTGKEVSESSIVRPVGPAQGETREQGRCGYTNLGASAMKLSFSRQNIRTLAHQLRRQGDWQVTRKREVCQTDRWQLPLSRCTTYQRSQQVLGLVASLPERRECRFSRRELALDAEDVRVRYRPRLRLYFGNPELLLL